jgi:hypothetical protein
MEFGHTRLENRLHLPDQFFIEGGGPCPVVFQLPENQPISENASADK